MFRQLKDEDGNTYTPVRGDGKKTYYAVNGNEGELLESSSKNPRHLQYQAYEEGLIDNDPFDLMFAKPRRSR